MDLELQKLKAKKIFESTYKDLATIKIFEKSVVNGLTKTNSKVLYSNIPCKLCFKNDFYIINQGVYGSNTSTVVLMISPELEIPLNSEIVVLKNDKEYHFINSNSMMLTTHQAVFLKSKEDKS